eukprot:4142716-Pyramimonas_sp.AAC.1
MPGGESFELLALLLLLVIGVLVVRARMPSRLWYDDTARASVTLFVLLLSPLPDASGRRWRFVSSFQDGPRPKRAQEALHLVRGLKERSNKVQEECGSRWRGF